MGEILSTIWNTILFYPFLNVLLVLYKILGENLGLAVIVLAAVIRLLMIPMTKKQMGMTDKMAVLRPRLDELQKKYKNAPQELSKAQMELYKEIGYNPLGCLGTFVPQILVLLAIVGVIGAVTQENFKGIIDPVREFVFNGDMTPHLDRSFLVFKDISKTFRNIVGDNYFSLEGIPYLVLAVVVGLSQFLSTKFMQSFQSFGKKKSAVKAEGTNKDTPMGPEEMQAQMMKSMNLVFPVMTGFLALQTSTVLGIYWITQSVMLVVQYFIIDSSRSMQVLKIFMKKEATNETTKDSYKKSNGHIIEEIPAKKINQEPVKQLITTKKDLKKKNRKKKKRKNKK